MSLPFPGLLSHLVLIPGLRNLKADHLDGDHITWKVRQVSFVAVFDELARQGVPGLEADCCKLRELCEARAAVLRTRKAKQPGAKLSLSLPALSTEAFRAAFAKVVVDTLFAFGEDSIAATDLARDDDTGANSTRCALDFLTRECLARRSEGLTPPPRVAFLHPHQQPPNQPPSNLPVSLAPNEVVDSEEKQQGGCGRRSAASSKALVATGSEGPILLGGRLPTSLRSPKLDNDKPNERACARNHTNKAAANEYNDDQSATSDTAAVVAVDSGSGSSTMDDDEFRDGRRVMGKWGVRPASQSQRLQQELLRNNMLMLRRELALEWSSADAHARVTDATSEVLMRLESSLKDIVHNLVPMPESSSSVQSQSRPRPLSPFSAAVEDRYEARLPAVPADYVGGIEGIDFEEGCGDNTQLPATAPPGMAAVSSNAGGIAGTRDIFAKLLRHISGLRQQLRDAEGSARRDQARCLRVGEPHSSSIGKDYDGVLTTPLLRRRLRRPCEVASRAFLDRDWRRLAEERRSTQPMAGTAEGIILDGAVGPTTSSRQPWKEGPSQGRTKPGQMRATGNGGLGGEEPLWPRGASSDILERTGWRDSFDGGGEGGAEDNPGGDPHGSLRDSIEEARFGADQNGTNALRNEYKATQQLVAAAGLEAVSPLSLVAIVAIAEALDATVNDLQTFAHTLHASGLTTNGGAPLTLPQPEGSPTVRHTGEHSYSTPNGKCPSRGERHSGGVKVEGTKMTPRSPKMNDGGDIEGLLMYPSTPARGDGSSTVTPAFADSASAGASLGELAHRARRISDTAADLGAKVTALATLLPLRLSGSGAPHGPGSRTKGGYTTGGGLWGGGSNGGGCGRPEGRDRIGDLAAGIAVKGAASRQRLKAIVRHADAAFEAGRKERALLRAELEQWRSRDAAMTSAVEKLTRGLQKDLEDLSLRQEQTLVVPLRAILLAHKSQSCSHELLSETVGTYEEDLESSLRGIQSKSRTLFHSFEERLSCLRDSLKGSK
jgi:hypothetical protein